MMIKLKHNQHHQITFIIWSSGTNTQITQSNIKKFHVWNDTVQKCTRQNHFSCI